METDQTVTGCGRCGVLAAAHGRREQVLHDAPFGHRRVRLRWRKRLWRCREPACATGTFTEVHDLAGPRAVLTARAVVWATDALAEDDTTVSALARRLGVDWHTLWHAVKVEAERRLARPGRLAGVSALGVDEHVWRPGRFGAGRDVTGMVDLSRDQHGRVRARLLDLVPGRSGPAYRAWLDARDGDLPGRRRSRPRSTRSAATPTPCATSLSDAVAGAGRLPRRQAGHPGRGRGPPPRPAGHPAPARPQATTRSTGSAGCCGTAPRHLTDRQHGG